MVQCQNSGMTVLCGDLLLRVQSLEDLLHLFGVAGQLDRFAVFFRIYADLILFRHVQKVIPSAVALKVCDREFLRVIRNAQLVGLSDHGIPGVIFGHFHRSGIIRRLIVGFGCWLLCGICRESSDSQRCRQHEHERRAANKFSRSHRVFLLVVFSGYCGSIASSPPFRCFPFLQVFVPVLPAAGLLL